MHNKDTEKQPCFIPKLDYPSIAKNYFYKRMILAF